MKKLGEPIIFFVPPGDVPGTNGGRPICAAIEKGQRGSGQIDLIAYMTAGPQDFVDIDHASSASNGLTGMKWCTMSEAESYGIDLTDPTQNLSQLP